MLIAFWSPFHGTGNSANLLAVAAYAAEKLKKNILITQTHFSMNNFEKPLLGDIDTGSFFEETGLDALVRHFKSGNVSAEQVKNCTIDISERLHLMAGTRLASRESFENDMMRSLVISILKRAEAYFDCIMVDLGSGDNKISKEILKLADIRAVTVRQSRYVMDFLPDFITADSERTVYILGCYDEYSKLSIRNLRYMYRFMKKDNIYGLRYSTGFSDAISDGKVWKFLKNIINSDSESPEQAFGDDIGKLALKLCRNCGTVGKTSGDVQEKYETDESDRDVKESWKIAFVREEKGRRYDRRKES